MKPLSKDGSRHVTDEFYNTLIMVIAALFAIGGTVALVYPPAAAHHPLAAFSFLVYGLTLVNVFVTSALHHGINSTQKVEHFLRELDYYSVFLVIAGTFTPFCLVALNTSLGYAIFALIWLLAISGILLKAWKPKISKWAIVSFYLAMGWLGIFLAQPLYATIGQEGVALIVLGGVFFTVGSAIYFLERPNPFPGRFGFHEIWHLHVIAGTASHFAVMYFYILPYSTR